MKHISKLAAIGLLASAPLFALDAHSGYASSLPKAHPGQSMTGMMRPADPADVRKIQSYLNNHGYKAGKVDGTWGSHTVAALERFQKAEGLNPNGQLNDQTLAKMDLQLGARVGTSASSQSEMSSSNAKENHSSNKQSSGSGMGNGY